MGEPATLTTRDLRAEDLDEVSRIDAHHTGRPQLTYWREVFAGYLSGEGRARTFGYAVDGEAGRLAGYLLGEIRAVEFGSSACGWIFAVGVDPAWLRRGVAAALLDRSCARFQEAGVTRARTMVRRADVPVLSFFRAHGFEGGPYVQLELDLEGSKA